MARPQAKRVLAFDTSLSCTGVALLEVKGGKVKVIDVGSYRTNADHSTALRTKHLEAWVLLFLTKHVRKGFDHIVREGYAGKFGHHTIFSAWAACDRALDEFSYVVGEKPIGQSTIKKEITGSGRAEKEDVEAGARKRITNHDVHIANDNESDAIAVGLTFIAKNPDLFS